MLEDFVERTYITAGIAAFFGLLLMALTSTRGWQRRLGVRWGALHNFIYAAVALAILHYFWLIRDDYTELAVYVAWATLAIVLRRYPFVQQPHRSSA